MILRKLLTAAALAALTSSVMAAEAKEEVTKAAKALAEKGYSWKTTTERPGGGGGGRGFGGGAQEGKADKDGTVYLTSTFRDNKTEAYVKGEKFAYTNQDGQWESAADAENAEGPGRFRALMYRNYKAPAAQAQEIAGLVKEMKKEGDAYTGDLTTEGAKTLMSFRGGRRGGDNAPEITGAKGTAKFWVKDGVLSKYQYSVQGKREFNGEERDLDRTTTVEIKDVGTTKLEVPEAAKKKLS